MIEQVFLSLPNLADKLCVQPRIVVAMLEQGIIPQPMRFKRQLLFYWPAVVQSLDRHFGPTKKEDIPNEISEGT